MSEQPSYGSTEDDPLMKSSQSKESNTIKLVSRLPIAIGMENNEFRAIVFGVLLFTFAVPSLVFVAIGVYDKTCDTDYCAVLLASYCVLVAGIFSYELSFIYLWWYGFMDSRRNSSVVIYCRKLSAILLGIGAILLLAAVCDDINAKVPGYQKYYKPAGTISPPTDKVSFFGIHLIPIFTSFALCIDILIPRFGDSIKIRCLVISGILFISSLLITIGVFNADSTLSNGVKSVVQFGWLITCISSFGIHICVEFGLYKYLKNKQTTRRSAFVALDYIAFCGLFSGIALTMTNTQGWIGQTRTAFLLFGMSTVLCIEIFLL